MVMKKLWIICVVGALSFPVCALGEGKANHDWAEEAALKYEEKAKIAAKDGDDHAARIYTRMAQIKRDAGAAAKKGRDFSWDEYHKLNAELNGGGKHPHKDHPEKDGKKDPGNGFLDAARDYDAKARMAKKAGDREKADIYSEMAEIKRQAAKAAKDGKEFSWDRYTELQNRLNKGHEAKAADPPKHHAPDRSELVE